MSLFDDGSLQFMGQDLERFDDEEYEYALTVGLQVSCAVVGGADSACLWVIFSDNGRP